MSNWSEQALEEARQDLIGRTITNVIVLPVNDRENYWETGAGEDTHAIVLDNGTMLIPIADTEGTQPGRMWVRPATE